MSEHSDEIKETITEIDTADGDAVETTIARGSSSAAPVTRPGPMRFR